MNQTIYEVLNILDKLYIRREEFYVNNEIIEKISLFSLFNYFS